MSGGPETLRDPIARRPRITRAAAALAGLQTRIVACRRCPRLVAHREAVAAHPPRRFLGERYWARPVPSLARVSARLLLVGLAPAAHGGNRTGRMFTGDAAGGSGEWVARALHAHGFATQPTSRRRRDGFRLLDAYITAAIHCVPPGNRPRPRELANCAGYLKEELRLLRRVRVVIALGRIGFDAYLRATATLGFAPPRPRPRFVHGAAIELPHPAGSDVPTAEGRAINAPGRRRRDQMPAGSDVPTAEGRAINAPGRRRRDQMNNVTLLACYHPSRRNTQTGRLTWPMFEAIFAEARRRLASRRERQAKGNAR